jgi:Tfp pilus assembly protein PilO
MLHSFSLYLGELAMPDQDGKESPVRYWHDRLALVIALLTLATQIGLALWWGGRFTQRFEYVETNQQAFEETLARMVQKDISHDVSFATINAQYGEIIKRLDRMDDSPRR